MARIIAAFLFFKKLEFMPLSISEKIKVVLGRRNMTLGDPAEKTGQTRQSLSNKMSLGNFTEKELRKIAEALDCSYFAGITFNDTGEDI